MAVKIGSARMGSNGKTTGDTAGDQGSEVSTQNWYLHGKGWYVFRAKDPKVREFIAQAMQWACDNKQIGYDQNQRDTLYNNVKPYGFDTRKTTKAVETDCSALVRVCIQYAFNQCGIDYTVANFRTATESTYIMKTGQFDKFTEDKYCKKSDYLCRGDILCTRTSGHTVVVLSNGSKYEGDKVVVVPTEPSKPVEDKVISVGTNVTVTASALNVRKGAGTEYGIYKTVHKGDVLNKVDITGWTPIVYKEEIRFVSNKYVDGNKLTGSVNVRKGAGTGYASVGTISKGSVIEIADITGWSPVEIKEAVYWVSNTYIK